MGSAFSKAKKAVGFPNKNAGQAQGFSGDPNEVFGNQLGEARKTEQDLLSADIPDPERQSLLGTLTRDIRQQTVHKGQLLDVGLSYDINRTADVQAKLNEYLNNTNKAKEYEQRIKNFLTNQPGQAQTRLTSGQQNKKTQPSILGK